MRLHMVYFGLFLYSAGSFSQETTVNLDDMTLDQIMNMEITTASKTAMSAEDAPGIITVVSKQEIENSGARTLSDVLNRVPGFTSGTSIQNGNHTNFYVRGSFSLNSEDILILKDGRRLNDGLSGGAMAFSPDFAINNIKQIEIIRGPGSALYGANAFVGVINIITEGLDETGLKVNARTGDNHAAYGSIQYRKRINDHFAFGLFVEQGQREFDALPLGDLTFMQIPIDIPGFNIEHRNLQSADRSRHLSTSFRAEIYDFKINFDYENKKNWDNFGLGVPAEPFTDILGNVTDLTDERFRHNRKFDVFRLGVQYEKPLGNNWSVNANANFLDFEDHTSLLIGANFNFSHTNIGEAFGYQQTSNNATNTTLGDVSFEWNPSEKHVTVFGYSYQEDEVEYSPSLSNNVLAMPGHPLYSPSRGYSIGLGPFYEDGTKTLPGTRNVNALYVQHTWAAHERLSLTGGVRGDDYSDFGGTINPRLAAVYSFSERANMKVLYGRAFRAPSFIETNRFVVNAILPTTDLDPEIISTYETQFNLRPTQHLNLVLTGYDYEIKDVIRQVSTRNPDANFEVISVNSGTRKGKGVEFESRFRSERGLDISMSYAYADTQDQVDGVDQPVEGVPKHSLNFSVNVNLLDDHWILNASAYRRWDWTPLPEMNLQIPGLPPVTLVDELALPNYTIVNFHTEYRLLNKNLAVTFDALNIGDKTRLYADQHIFAPRGVPQGKRQFLLGFRWAP